MFMFAGLLDPNASVTANVQYMALTVPEYVYDFSLKLFKNFKGNECLQGTGETAAVDRQVILIHLDGGIAFRLDPDIVGSIQPDIGHRFQIHRGCENAAALVISMVSTDFRSAVSGEYIVFFHNHFSVSVRS